MMRALSALSLAAAAVVSLSAHHSFAADYFENEKISIEGDVIAFELVNPHAWLRLAVVDADGTRQTFSAEWSNPSRLKRAGFAADSFKPGDRLVLTGSPGRNPAERRMHLRRIHRPADGWTWPKSGRDDEP